MFRVMQHFDQHTSDILISVVCSACTADLSPRLTAMHMTKILNYKNCVIFWQLLAVA